MNIIANQRKVKKLLLEAKVKNSYSILKNMSLGFMLTYGILITAMNKNLTKKY